MSSTWTWDETLFGGSAPYYLQGRLPYAPALADRLAAALPLDGAGRLLDMGCGPGKVALALAEQYESVVGLDASPEMLAEAARVAAEQGVTNVEWVHRRAEDLPGDLGSFRTVTFAASFHWMDRPKVAAAVRTMLDPGGAVVHVDKPRRHRGEAEADPPASLAHPKPPREAIRDLRVRYLGPERRAGQSVRTSSPSDEDEVFRAAGFTGPESVAIPDGREVERTIDDIVANTFSMSATAPHHFGDRLADFEADLRALLVEACPDGLFSEILPGNIARIWRPTA